MKHSLLNRPSLFLGNASVLCLVAIYLAAAPASQAQRFGDSVAIDGRYTVISIPNNDIQAVDSGAVRVFDSNSGALLYTILNPTPAEADRFGREVAISGTRVVISAANDDTGATDTGSAYVYDLASATPTVPVLTLNNPSPANNDVFGSSVGISGTLVVVGVDLDDTGATNSGIAYIYDLASATPTVPVFTLINPTPALSDNFGITASISGTRVVIGAPGDDTGAPDAGSAYVYDLSSATPTAPVATLNNPNPSNGGFFAFSVGISGTRVVVGAPNDDTGSTNAGRAYVYDLSSGTPTVPVATLNNPSPAASDIFGDRVAISGTRALISAPNDDTGATDAGSAYVYDLSSATPTVPVITLNNPSPQVGDEFGFAVAISGTRAVVGASLDDMGGTDAGSAYVYDLSSGTPTVPIATLSNPTQALNISTRLRVGVDDAKAISGFIIRGSVSKSVVIRGIGPSLVNAGIPTANVLADPFLELHASDGTFITSNDNWKNSPQRSQIEGTVFQPTDEREAVIVATLAPGTYTVVMGGSGRTTGVGVIEVYDTAQQIDCDLANISSRGLVETGNNMMFGGFILSPNSNPTRLAVRALGPSLAAAGVPNPLADPTLEVRNPNGTVLVANDDWQSDSISAGQLTANALAPSNAKEAAIFIPFIQPGQFTVIVAGKNQATGIGLVEIYNLR